MDLQLVSAELVPEGEQLRFNSRDLALAGFLASYRNVHTRQAYGASCRRWFVFCDAHGLDVLTGVKRAHIELWLRQLEHVLHLANVAAMKGTRPIRHQP